MRKRLVLLLMVLAPVLLLAGCAQKPELFAALPDSALEQYQKGTEHKFTKEDQALDLFSTVLENSRYRLLYNEKTAETAVEDKGTQTVFRSNPEGWSQDAAGAQLLITLCGGHDVLYSWDSCSQAAAYGQFSAKTGDGTFDVTYVFGKTEKVYLAPEAMTVEAFNALMEKVTGSNKTFLKMLYSYLELKDSDAPKTRETLLSRFPILTTMPIYALKQGPTKMELTKAEKILSDIGYTMENRLADEAAVSHAAQAAQQLHAAVTLRYQLTDEGLVVTVPADGIALTTGAKLTDLTVLPYFGTDGENAAGYALLPDGCGALMDFSKVRDTGYPAYAARVYGTDYANQVTDKNADPAQVFLPVYGVKGRNGALVGLVKKGESLASIVADAPREGGAWSYAGVRFILMENTYFSLDAKPENRILVFQPKANLTDLQLEYRFLPGSGADYSQMAAALSQAMEDAGLLPGITESKSLPLVLETVGAIDVQKLLLGIPVTQVKALTTLAQSGEMATDLQAQSGGGPLNLVLSGIQTGGLRSTRQRSVSVEGKLGSMEELKRLQSSLQAAGIALSITYDGLYVHKDRLLDGFSASADTARLLTSAIAFKPDYTLSTMYMDKGGLSAYMLSREAIQTDLGRFAASLKEQGLDGVTLTTMGRELFSDMSAARFTSREEMRETVRAGADGLCAQAKVTLKGANSYLLPDAGLVYDLPMRASAHPLLTQSVPLVQMILGGRVAYAAPSIQYQSDPAAYALACIETGSGLSAQAFAAEGEAVKYTDYDGFYSGSFQTVLPMLASAYRQVNKALAPVRGQPVTAHSRQGTVTRTTFGNGVSIYVNHGTQTAVYLESGREIRLPGSSYQIGEEGEACGVAVEN